MDSIQLHLQAMQQAAMKSAPAVTPGLATWLASNLGWIEQTLSITLLALSIGFLIWRWWIAYKLERENHDN